MSTKEETNQQDVNQGKATPEPSSICGIVMPISEIDGCSSQHWEDVLNILQEAIIEADLKPNLVSVSNESSVIQKIIVQNLYENEIVVCDVSGKNSNVMFELGMRLAFDKPTIIVKDQETDFSFDTSVIEHILYPRSLHYQSMINFKNTLTKKIADTLTVSKEEDYSTFLKHFGTYKSASLGSQTLPEGELILKRLDEMDAKFNSNPLSQLLMGASREKQMCVKGDVNNVKKFTNDLLNTFPNESIYRKDIDNTHFHLTTKNSLKDNEDEIRQLAVNNKLKLNWLG